MQAFESQHHLCAAVQSRRVNGSRSRNRSHDCQQGRWPLRLPDQSLA